MEIKILAARFLELRTQRDEKRRFIDYDMKNQLKRLEADQGNVEAKLRILTFKDQIEAEEVFYQQISDELLEVIEELKPYLINLNAHANDPLTTHVHDKTYFDVWLDENQEIQSAGLYTKWS